MKATSRAGARAISRRRCSAARRRRPCSECVRRAPPSIVYDVVEEDALDADRIAHEELIAEHALCFPDGFFISHHGNRGERIVFHHAEYGKERKSLCGRFGPG